MKEKYFETHLAYMDQYKNREQTYKLINKQYKIDLLRFFQKLNDGGKVLEIGFGIGKFANFCHENNFDYTGIDRDGFFGEKLKKEFPKFNFYEANFQEYAQNHKDEYDIIFLSHVFEHLNEKERVECIESIHKMLKSGGKWINIMPNADCDLRMFMGRYGDITHYTIYTHYAFSQIIETVGGFSEIKSYNKTIGITSIFHRFIHKIFVYLTKIYYIGMGLSFPEIYTREFISVIKKE